MNTFFGLILLGLIFIEKFKLTIGYRLSYTNITKQQLCLTEACIETSSQLFKSMDRSVNPCQDFNKFVCGRFIKESLIPDRQQQIDLTTTKIKDVMYDRGQKLMETRSEMEEFEIDKKIRSFYTTCSDVVQREQLGLKPLLDILDSIGGWPVLRPNGMLLIFVIIYYTSLNVVLKRKIIFINIICNYCLQ